MLIISKARLHFIIPGKRRNLALLTLVPRDSSLKFLYQRGKPLKMMSDIEK